MTQYNFDINIRYFQVECSPLCEIVWLKDGVAINEDDERYIISSGEKPPNPAKNDFESVYSSLNFNINRWPDGKLGRVLHKISMTTIFGYMKHTKIYLITNLKISIKYWFIFEIQLLILQSYCSKIFITWKKFLLKPKKVTN